VTAMARMASGAAWMIAVRLADRGLGVVSTMVLARLLVPGDFGLVAMAMSVISLIELVGAFSFDVALIRKAQPDREHYDTAFTFNAVFGVGCALLMLVIAYPAATFYREPRLLGVIGALSLAWAAQGFENIGVVNFRRELRFDREFRFLATKRVIAFAITMTAAFTLRSYWALVAGTVVGRLAGTTLSYFVHPYRPRFSLAARAEMMSFSSWLQVNNILNFVIAQCSSFVIGRTAGSHELGLYTVAHEVGSLPTSEIVAPINRAVYPSYAQMVEDRGQLRAGFLHVLSAVTLFAIPAACGIAAIAEPLIVLFLGSKWLEAASLLKVLGFLGAVAAISTNTYPAFLALGRPRLPTAVSAVRMGVIVPAMIVAGWKYGAIGVAWVELSSGLIFVPLSWALLFPLIGVRLPDCIGVIYRPAVAAAVMYLGVRAILPWDVTGASASSVARLIFAVLFGVVVYFLGVLALWFLSGRANGAEQQLLRLARERFGARAQ